MNRLKKLSILFFIVFNTSVNIDEISRNYLEIKLEKKWSSNDFQSQVFRSGRGFFVDDKHQLYISDIGDRTIKIFNAQGKFLRTIGKAKGAGPGEIIHPIAFDVDSDGNIWIADPANSRVAIYKNNGTFIRHIKLEVIPYRIKVSDSGDYFYIINLNASPNGKFTKFSGDGKVIKQFGIDIIENQLRNDMVLAGEIAVGKSGNLFYSPDFAGLILGYTPNGKVLFKTTAIFPTTFPKVVYNAQGGSWVDRDAKRVSRGISFENDKVSVFSTASPSNEIRSLDFYNNKTGKYLHSIKLPNDTYQAYLKDETLYTLNYKTNDMTLSAWHIKNDK